MTFSPGTKRPRQLIIRLGPRFSGATCCGSLELAPRNTRLSATATKRAARMKYFGLTAMLRPDLRYCMVPAHPVVMSINTICSWLLRCPRSVFLKDKPGFNPIGQIHVMPIAGVGRREAD